MVRKFRIKKQEKRNRYNIYQEDEFLFSVSDTTLGAFNVTTPKKLEEINLDELKNFEDKQRILDKAYSLINRRTHGEEELRRKLKERYKNQDIIEWALEKIKKKGLVDDLEVASQITSSSKDGKIKIRSKLIKKGLSKDAIDKAMSQIDERVEEEKANNYLNKRGIDLSSLNSFKEKQKAYQKLKTKGFEAEIIRKVLGI